VLTDTLDEASAAMMLRDFAPRGLRAAHVWPHIRTAVSEAVAASTSAPRTTAKYLSHVSDFAAWAYEQGLPLTPGGAARSGSNRKVHRSRAARNGGGHQSDS